MSRIKKVSFIFIFFALTLFASFGLSFPMQKIYAEEDNNILLSVKKIDGYSNSSVTKPVDPLNPSNTDTVIKKLGEYTSEELYTNLTSIEYNVSSSLNNNDVVSINKGNNDAILVSLKPNSEFGSIIKILNPSLKINGTNISIETYSVNGNNENRIFLMAFDFTSLIDNLGQPVSDAALSGKYEFTFNYSYTTNGTNVISNSQSFNFYLIDESSYLTNNVPFIGPINKIDNSKNENNENDITYYYNYQTIETPTLTYNPFKFQPKISFTYNETNVILETKLNTNKNQVELTSSNEKIFKSQTFNIDNYLANINLTRLGSYSIEYGLVINNEVITNSTQFEKITNYPTHTLYVYGFEAYHTNYSSQNSSGGYDYSPFHNETFRSDFSDLTVTSLSDIATKYDAMSDEEKTNFVNSIASTNQAPVKIDAYITSLNASTSKWAKLNPDTFAVVGSQNSFSTSKRFGSEEETGIFAVWLEYTFTNGTDQKQLIIFKIENDTPTLTYAHEDDTTFPSNKFTNKNVKVSWNALNASPFSVEPIVTFTKNNTLINPQINETEDTNYKYTILEDSGEYLVTIKYGINHTTSVEKNFTIDKEIINYKVYGVSKDVIDNCYKLSNELTKKERTDNVIEYTTNSPFSIFTLKKAIANNEITVSYEYISLEDNNLSEINYIVIDGKLYVYNNKILKTLYTGLDYINKELNNISNFNELNDYAFTIKDLNTNAVIYDNTNAVISYEGLHKFVITDKAGNTQELFVLLDSSSPVVLQTNEVFDSSVDHNEDSVLNSLDLTNWLSKNELSVKTEGINFVSDNYSLIVGNGKYIKLDPTNAQDFASKYLGLDEVTEIQNIKQNYSGLKIDLKQIAGKTTSNVYTLNNDYNIVSVTPPQEEVEILFTVGFSSGNKTYSRKFDLNTDKNQILIYGKNDIDGYFRVYQSNITSSKYLYIRFIDEYEDEYKLASLNLNFYPFNVDNENRIIQATSLSTFDLLNTKETCNIEENLDNSILTDGYLTKILNPMHEAGENVTNEGKYEIVKTYVGFATDQTKYPQISQTFYVDRTNPIEQLNNVLIGKNNSFTLGDAILSAENILNYIANDIDVVTNKLPITSSIDTNNYKYNGEDEDLKKFEIYYDIYYSNNELLYSTNVNSEKYSKTNYVFTQTGKYIFKIYDNSGYDWYDEKNKGANYIEFNIEITDSYSPAGSFIVHENEEITNRTSSTNSNNLSFTFNDSASEFLYDIDIYNIKLTKDNSVILQTYNINNKPGSCYEFTFEDGSKVYYTSILGPNVFKLTRTQLSSKKIPNETIRYSYTLTIINPSIESTLVSNGISLEACYKLNINYTKTTSTIPNINLSQEYTIYIDHTAPYSNVNSYIDEDKFLTNEEKEALKQSVANKDRSGELNFENYVFFINNPPTLFENELSFLDTERIYIRKYNKYNNSTIEDYQSLVPGDSEYTALNTTRYKFDVNLKNLSGYNVYTTKEYNKTDLNSFFSESGFYEIIEIDGAFNYTVYTVYYGEENLKVNYEFNNTSSSVELGNKVELNGLGFNLSGIEINEKDYLNIEVSINKNVYNLRYLPFEVENAGNYTYFSSLTKLVEYINNLISTNNSSNSLGNQYIIKFTNRNGNTVTLTNNTPNELLELQFIDYIDSFTITLPSASQATYVKKFYVYPVIGDTVSTTKLTVDSNNKPLPTNNEGEAITTNTYTFNNEYSIYYIIWTDNFNRTQYKVKTIGVTDTKYLDFGNEIHLNVNGEEYTKNANAELVYNKSLYRLEAKYQLLPNLEMNDFTISNDEDGIVRINMLDALINAKEFDEEFIKRQEIRFIITLTDLSTSELENLASLGIENVPATVYTISYVYYPTMPSLVFTDSASNTLPIYANETNIVSTSKNVTLNYINNTLFKLTIEVARTYVNDLNQEDSETIIVTTNEYTFTNLGKYTISVTNELGKKDIYEFSIKTATNKTYSVNTSEANMQNFEINSSSIKLAIEINGEEENFETYYSIYSTTIEVNSDFNLELKEIPNDDISNYSNYPNTRFYKIIKTDTETVYKYVALVKVDYNSNFLNLKSGEPLLAISNNISDLVQNIKGYSIKTTENISIKLPKINKIGESNLTGNEIIVKMLYNGKQVSLNKNIYSVDATHQTINLKNVPAGIYNFYFEDLAGNVQLFNGNTFLSVIMLNEVIATINGETPIDYQIYNTGVNLKIEQEIQYDTRSIEISATKNGNSYKPQRNTSGEYVFSEYGLYEVKITAKILGLEISKTLHFTILNDNEAYREFSYIGLNGQTISKITRNGTDVTNEIKKFMLEGNSTTDLGGFSNAILYNLHLASTIYRNKTDGGIKTYIDLTNIADYDSYLASGKYEIFINNENSLLNAQTFSFNVWIREENVKILLNSTLEEGGSTSSAIDLTFNPYLIYSQIGECQIYLNENSIFEINKDSENKVQTYTIPRSAVGTYIVQVRTNSGNTELSFVLNKTEPLSTVTIIVIIVSSVLLIGGIIIFIKLRTRMKVK